MSITHQAVVQLSQVLQLSAHQSSPWIQEAHIVCSLGLTCRFFFSAGSRCTEKWIDSPEKEAGALHGSKPSKTVFVFCIQFSWRQKYKKSPHFSSFERISYLLLNWILSSCKMFFLSDPSQSPALAQVKIEEAKRELVSLLIFNWIELTGCCFLIILKFSSFLNYRLCLIPNLRKTWILNEDLFHSSCSWK